MRFQPLAVFFPSPLRTSLSLQHLKLFVVAHWILQLSHCACSWPSHWWSWISPEDIVRLVCWRVRWVLMIRHCALLWSVLSTGFSYDISSSDIISRAHLLPFVHSDSSWPSRAVFLWSPSSWSRRRSCSLRRRSMLILRHGELLLWDLRSEVSCRDPIPKYSKFKFWGAKISPYAILE